MHMEESPHEDTEQRTVKRSRLCPPKMCLWHEDYFRLLFLRNNGDRRNADKLHGSYPSARDVYIYKGNPPSEGVPLTACGRRGASQSLETLISGEGGDFHLHRHLTLVC